MKKGRLFKIFYLFTFAAYILTSIFLVSYNSEIASDSLAKEEEVERLEESVNALRLNVRELKSAERIKKIAKEHGLEQNPNNVTIVGGN